MIADRLGAAWAAHIQLQGQEPEGDEVERMLYGAQKIKPETHAELAIVVWSGLLSPEITHPYIDEYCRRRLGDNPLLPYHPVLDSQLWYLPNTKGLILYKEQRAALVRELCGLVLSDSEVAIKLEKIDCGDESFDNFTSTIRDTYKELLDSEKVILFKVIKESAGVTLSYSYCSTLADQAGVMKVTQGQ